jgi:thiosulfate/3-mercaptopyruvate sulfurtransferase
VTDVTRDELVGRLDEPGLTLLDVRTGGEYDGSAGYPCDPRQGHIPGARHLELQGLLAAGDAAAIKALVGRPDGAEVIAYCHSGGRSAIAVEVLVAAGYEARNYVGSWHEWAADESLPVATDQPAA